MITQKSECTGCHACFSGCPASCIAMTEDEEGFLYPHIAKENCIDCGACEKVCPVINQEGSRKPLRVYAAKNPDEKVRMESSSGGIFTLLAEQILNEGGVVFGARFNEKWEVVHDYTETREGLAAFRGSKYVQSVIGNTYGQAYTFLESGRKVLFSGTPCQIAGLKAFLKKDYDGLITVDLVCHGVPSPLVWRKYLDELVETTPPPPPPPGESKGIRNINFRDKTFGWKIFSLSIRFIREGVMARDNSKISNIKFRHKEHGKRRNKFLVGSAMSDSHDFVESLHRNIFMKGFLGNLYLRPSCYNCPVRSLKSGADITIGDYWGIENILPDFDDDRGVSLVLINTEKGGRIYDRLNKIEMETSYHDALRGNPSLESSVVLRPGRKHFFLNFEKKGVIESIRRLTRTGVHIHMKNIINYILRKVGIITHRS